MSSLQGTFGCWYYDANIAELRIFRSGSTLFSAGGDFSSVQVSDEYKDITEGDVLVYNFTNNTFNRSGNFELNMVPFFL